MRLTRHAYGPFLGKTPAMTTAGVAMVMLPVLLMLCLATNEVQLSQQDDVNRISCPGCQWVCEDDETCCQMLSGDWGCCYLPNVCLSPFSL